MSTFRSLDYMQRIINSISLRFIKSKKDDDASKNDDVTRYFEMTDIHFNIQRNTDSAATNEQHLPNMTDKR